ncbi:unnamed protein product [Brassica oleracea var. botrytis]|uniref:Major facilitator superfamily (MFS) profile domain-containing protein n=1 Tax=Brassica oleracea var. oleracea TaxID=109376 RepID=A0A0D3AND8_BRAOL
MANTSAPLLSQTEDKDTSSHFTFDKIVEHSLSEFELSQILQIILVGLASTFDSQQIFITVFTDAHPTWHCLDHTICNPATSDICGIPRSAWDWDGGFKGKSVISEFGLECSSSFLRGLPTSTFYVGVFMAMIPDGFFGRKQLLFFTTLAMSITGISIYFSSNIWIYAFLKFVIGFMRAPVGTLHVAVRNLISFPTRFLESCLSLHVCSRSCVYCIFLYLFAIESPRWLHLQGKDEEAIEMLKKISPANKGSGLSYYGVPLAVRDIKVNIYLSEALNAVVELPTFVITPILLEKFSRRSSVVVNCLIGGASGMLCFVLSLFGMTNTAFALELASFFCGRIQFNVMAVYMVELFPTCVRNTATLMLRQALVVAGACSPIIASIGRDVPSLSFAAFGIAMAGLGLFALLLPETKGSSLCDTMEAQEERDRVFNTSQSCLK